MRGAPFTVGYWMSCWPRTKAANSRKGAIKFRTPKTPITVPDLICGDIQFDRTNEPDLVIQRK